MSLQKLIDRRYPRLGRFQRLIYRGRAWVGSFACEPRHPAFEDSGPTLGYILAFPREPVKIHHPRRRPLLADANTITLYNRGQRYRREAVSPAGDRCIWLGFGASDVRDAVTRLGLSHADLESRPIAWTHSRCPREAFLLQRRLLAGLLSKQPPDWLEIEDTAMRLLELALEHAVDADPRRDWRRASRTARRHLELAQAAGALLARRTAEALHLTELADELQTSPFHLSRLFRAAFGLPLHQYHARLRVRQAVDRMLDAPAVRLTDLALDAGFASASHLTQSCRNYLGHTPSRLRKLLTRAGGQDSANNS